MTDCTRGAVPLVMFTVLSLLVNEALAVRSIQDTLVADRFGSQSPAIVSVGVGGASISPVPLVINTSKGAAIHCGTQGGASHDPLTGLAYPCTEDDVVSGALEGMVDDAVQAAIGLITDTFGVKLHGHLASRTSPVVVPRGRCSASAVPDDSFLLGPSEHLKIVVTMSGPSSANGIGVPNGTAPDDALTWSVICSKDEEGRPLLGHLNIIASRMEPTIARMEQSALWRSYTRMIAHELIHLLGFTAVGGFSTSPTSSVTKAIGLSAATRRGKQLYELRNEGLVAVLRDISGCSTVGGLELEDSETRPVIKDGGVAAMPFPSSHLETRIAMGDLLTVNFGEMLITPLTVAVVNALPWYVAEGPVSGAAVQLDASSALRMSGKGCAYTNELCSALAARESAKYPWCFPFLNSATLQPIPNFDVSPGANEERSCSAGALGFAPCSIIDHGAGRVPEEHFPYLYGGRYGGDADDDYCPSVGSAETLTRCVDTAANAALLHSNSPQSRCVTTTINATAVGVGSGTESDDVGNATKGQITARDHVRCMVLRCVSGKRVEIARVPEPVSSNPSHWVACPLDGSAGSILASSFVRDLAGNVVCPAAASVCGDPTLLYDEPTPQFDLILGAPFPRQNTTAVSLLYDAVAKILGVSSSDLRIISSLTESFVRFEFKNPVNVTAAQIETILGQVVSSRSNPVLAELSVTGVVLVPSCDTYCPSDRTQSWRTGADRKTCTCYCSGRFSGPKCETCPFPYGGDDCDRCAAGLTGFPSCESKSQCDIPGDRAVVIGEVRRQLSTLCSAAEARITSTEIHCEREACLCKAGLYDDKNRRCNQVAFHRCRESACDYQRRLCEVSSLQNLLNESASNFATEAANCTALSQMQMLASNALVLTTDWCKFDACESGACPVNIREAYCTTIVRDAAQGTRLLPAIVMTIFLVVVTLVL